MSSHREAPSISQDPVADNADTYAFVSPDDPTTVTIITNYVPLEGPPGGPNFFEFGDDVLYSIFIDNDGDARPDIEYQFQFNTTLRNEDTFLYNTGPIGSLDSPNWNKRQFYSVSVQRGGGSGTLGQNLACPPCNIGPRSTPNYDALAAAARHHLPSGEWVFAGQRNDGFFVELDERRSPEDAEHPPDRDQDPDLEADAGRLRAERPVGRQVGARHLGRRKPAQGAGARRAWEGDEGERAVGAGFASRQPALQRGHRADRGQGPLERARPDRRQGLREIREEARARGAPERPLSGRVPEHRGVHGRPDQDPG